MANIGDHALYNDHSHTAYFVINHEFFKKKIHRVLRQAVPVVIHRWVFWAESKP